MKAQYTNVLDDPRAPVKIPLLPHDRKLRKRVSDEELVARILYKLDRAASLQDLYKSGFRIQRGKCGTSQALPKEHKRN